MFFFINLNVIIVSVLTKVLIPINYIWVLELNKFMLTQFLDN